jgi:hypothetical protein
MANILNKPQAEAVYSAMCALNNVNGLISAYIRTDSGRFIEIHENSGGIFLRADELHLPLVEDHRSQSAFAAAYGLNELVEA